MGNSGSCKSSKCTCILEKSTEFKDSSGNVITEEMIDKVMEDYWLMYDPEQRDIISKTDSKEFTKKILGQFRQDELFRDRLYDQVWDRVN